VKSNEDKACLVKILKMDEGRLLLDGEEVEISAKLRKHNGLEITKSANGLEISSLKPGRLF
jgi:hypothetical protein